MKRTIIIKTGQEPETTLVQKCHYKRDDWWTACMIFDLLFKKIDRDEDKIDVSKGNILCHFDYKAPAAEASSEEDKQKLPWLCEASKERCKECWDVYRQFRNFDPSEAFVGILGMVHR